MMGSIRGKSKDRTSPRKPSPPEPSYMDSKQFASYLASLRDNRVTRPGGARPPPSPSVASTARLNSDRIAPGRPSIGGSTINTEASAPASSSHLRSHSDIAKPSSIRPSLVGSMASRYSTASGRDYYPEKSSPTKPLRPDEVVPTSTYMERGSRWMEKEEVFSLRTALEDMDLKDAQKEAQKEHKEGEASGSNDDESRLYNAALDEAAELVWQHQNGIKPREPGAPYSYKTHLREKSYAYARTASTGPHSRDVAATGLARDGPRSRSVSGSSSGSDGRASLESPRMSLEDRRQDSMDSTRSKTYGSLAQRVAPSGRRRSSMKRNISGEVEKPFSGDQIWEEPEGDAANLATTKPIDKPAEGVDQPLRLKLRNSPNKVQFSPDTSPEKDKESAASAQTPPSPTKPLQRVEIYKNPPSQSRNPAYTSNTQKPAGPRVNDSIKKKNGVEVRGDDIRQATSFKLGDRSRKLPTPSAVSDAPGRPIVSFDQNWKAPEEAAADKSPERKKEPSRFSVGNRQDQEGSDARFQPQPNTQASPSPPIPSFSFTPAAQVPSSSSLPSSSTPSIPSISVDAPGSGGSGPSIPMIITPDDNPAPPSITVSGEQDAPSIPIIVTPDGDGSAAGPSVPIIVTPGDGGDAQDSGAKPSARPLPTPTRRNPFMRANRGSQGHWSAAPGASARATAICHECSLPIEGRVITLRGGGERFHPQCFSCYTCGTSLEALEISPEPDSFRSARLDRIARRAAGETLPEEPGQTMAEDGDARLRFFCHLDWHELFAPRCKTCTTPILGDHIVALGHHFHYGHFFCAECGDPFEQGMTHIEKDGYAWCVKCQTKRTERRAPKCKRCKLPVIGQYVQALGGEWHDECFRCGTCGGGFDDGQIFPVADGIRCTACRMRELKA